MNERVRRVDSGETKPIPGEAVFAELRRKFTRPDK